jgi:hypothetical protein
MNFGSRRLRRRAPTTTACSTRQTLAKNAQDLDFNYRDRQRQLRSSASQISPWMAAGSSLLSGSRQGGVVLVQLRRRA